MKKFTNVAAASVLAGALVLASTPANAATTVEEDATTAATTEAGAPKDVKTQEEKLSWEEQNKRDLAKIEITDARLDNALKGLTVTNGIIESSSNLKGLFIPTLLKGENGSTVLQIIASIAKLAGKVAL